MTTESEYRRYFVHAADGESLTLTATITLGKGTVEVPRLCLTIADRGSVSLSDDAPSIAYWDHPRPGPWRFSVEILNQLRHAIATELRRGDGG